MAKSNVAKLLGPDAAPVVPFESPIIAVQLLQATELLNLGMLHRVTSTQAILTKADGGVYVSSSNPEYNFREFIPFSAMKSIRYAKGQENA